MLHVFAVTFWQALEFGISAAEWHRCISLFLSAEFTANLSKLYWNCLCRKPVRGLCFCSEWAPHCEQLISMYSVSRDVAVTERLNKTSCNMRLVKITVSGPLSRYGWWTATSAFPKSPGWNFYSITCLRTCTPRLEIRDYSASNCFNHRVNQAAAPIPNRTCTVPP